MRSLSIPLGSSVKVVRADEVENLTNTGWHLIGTIENEEIETGYECVPKPQNPNNGYYDANQTISLSKPFKVRRTKFVMVFETDERIEQLQTAMEASESCNRTLEAEVSALKKDLAAKDEKHKQVEAYFRKAETDLADANRRLQVAETTVQTLRNERTKFEKALGTLGVEQILSDQKFTGQVEVLRDGDDSSVPDRFNRVGDDS